MCQGQCLTFLIGGNCNWNKFENPIDITLCFGNIYGKVYIIYVCFLDFHVSICIRGPV